MIEALFMSGAFILIMLLPVAVWLLARIIFTAYFAAKAQFLRRFFNGNPNQETKYRDHTDS